MKTCTPALLTLITENNVHAWADLYTIHFASGVRRWTTAGADVTLPAPDGRVFTSGQVVVDGRPVSKSTAKLEAAEIEFTLVAGDAVTVSGLSLRRAAVAGLFDGVRLVAERAGYAADGSVAGSFVLFDGRIEDVEPGSTGVRVTATSPVSWMGTRVVPPRVIQASCPFVLYDAATCGVVEATFTDARTVATGSTARVVNLSATSTRAVVGGRLVVGGEERAVTEVSGAAVTLSRPLSSVPAVGAAVSVIAGCDRRKTTCQTYFNNVARFGGFNSVPKTSEAA